MRLQEIERIKTIISPSNKKNITISKIAETLDMSKEEYMEKIKKEKVPYEQIVNFGLKHKIDLNYLFLNEIEIV